MGKLNIEVSTRPEDLVCYGYDASGLKGRAAMVAWPGSAAEVAELMRWADAKGLAIVTRGAGTGMTGGSVPSDGALVLSTERMNRIIEINPGNLDVVVEPGVINGALQRSLKGRGLFYPPDPASLEFCTLGGNVAENAGGPRALKYGVTGNYVMQIEAVLPSGQIITVGTGTHKGVVGYDLRSLLVGSEGTLAVMTKIRLRVLPLPGAISTMLCVFDRIETAGEAVARVIGSGIIPRTLEFMDRSAVRAVEGFKPTGLPLDAEAMLLMELDGHEAAVREEAARASDICVALGANISVAAGDEERERLWEARRAISPALHNLGLHKINEDIVVPRPMIPRILTAIDAISARTGILIVNFGHAGDGNIHVNIMAERDDPARLAQAHALVGEIFKEVLDLGGTISGEHGVGLTKGRYIQMEVREVELGLMRAVKRAFDPLGRLNPGKVFPQ